MTKVVVLMAVWATVLLGGVGNAEDSPIWSGNVPYCEWCRDEPAERENLCISCWTHKPPWVVTRKWF